MVTSSKTVVPTTLKGIGDNYGWLHPQVARTGEVFLYYRFGYNQKGNQAKWLHHIPIFRMELFVLGGVKVGAELE